MGRWLLRRRRELEAELAALAKRMAAGANKLRHKQQKATNAQLLRQEQASQQDARRKRELERSLELVAGSRWFDPLFVQDLGQKFTMALFRAEITPTIIPGSNFWVSQRHRYLLPEESMACQVSDSAVLSSGIRDQDHTYDSK